MIKKLIRKRQTAAGGPMHYSRTMTTGNLSKAANYVGEYVLKGLGAVGKFLNAGFTSPTYGTIGQVSYARNTEDAKRLRELSEASEQAMGKAMTWVSPLNYGTALATGNGLNARKGEEEVASWSPAWQAVGRLGELYVGPKAVKGVKSAPRVVVNTAAKAGVKPAKAAVVAREINKGIKQNTNNGRIEVTGNYFNSPDKLYRITETPEKRINFTPTKLLEPSKTSSTIQISPEELYKVLKDQELNGYYFMGHGTGRSNVNPQIIFDNGLRIKNGDIGNTTSPISLSNLSLWPHANSKEIIILPGRAGNVKFDSARGRIPSDWYDDKTFQWNDNPGFEGSGLFAVLKPNATFVETEINGVPGVYTKPEAILGSYNIDTQTLKLNPRSLYEFLFNVPKLAEPRTSLAFFERKPAKISEAERAGIPKGERNLPKPSFRSELDWSYKDWFEKTAGRKYKDGSLTQYTDEDIKELNSHIPEYLEIEARSKKNGTWLKMEDGSNWYGDSRSWVLMLSKNLKLHNPEDFWTGVHNSENFLETNSINPEYNGKIWGVYGQKLLSAAKARTYAPNDNLVFHMVSSKKTPTVVYDALGKPWYDIGGLKVGDQYITGKTTDEIINDNFSKGIGRVKINNVSDTGPNKIKTNSKYSTGDFMLDWETFNSPGVHQNDIILSPGSFRKSLLGNNGAFNYKNKNIYRGLIPLAGGYTLYNLFNQPLQQLQYLKQGGKMNILEFLKNGSGIHIKKKNRGSFTRWCGGNVTEECIRRGKASSNPKIRKKATFADNARHFKHEQGGIIKAKEGFKWSDILNNSGLGNLFSLGIQAYSSNKIADNNLLMQDASLEMEKNKELLMVPQLANQMFPQMMGPINPENPNEKSGVYAKYLYGKLESMLNGQINLTYENKKRINRLQTQSLKDLNLMNVLSGVGDTVSSIASYIGNKKNSTTPTTSNYQLDSFWTNPSLS